MPKIPTAEPLKFCSLYWNEQRTQHELRWKDDTGKRKTLKVPNNQDAEAFAFANDELIGAGFVNVSKKTQLLFKDFLPSYYAWLDRQVHNYQTGNKYGDKIKPARRKCVRSYIQNHILPELGEVPINQVSVGRVKRLQRELSQKMLPQTVNSVIGTLNQIMTMAIEEEVIEVNPVPSIKRLQAAPPEPRYTPVKEEVELILDHCEGWHKTLIMLAAGTGMRISEILALEWSCLRGNVISVKASAVKGYVGACKTADSVRRLQIDSRLKARLAELKLQSTGEFIFSTKDNKVLDGIDMLRQVLYPAIKRAGVPKFGFHGLRRFYCNELERQGVPKDFIQTKMGHAIGSATTGKHYRALRDEDHLKDDWIIEVGR